MKRVELFGVAAAVAGMFACATVWAADPPMSGPAANGSPAWRMLKGFPDPGGRTNVAPDGVVTVVPRVAGQAGAVGGDVPACAKSTICTRRGGPSRQVTNRVTWDEMPGWTMSFPFRLPPGFGGAPGAAVDSKDNVWIMQRAPEGQPQLFKYSPTGQQLVSIPAALIKYQEKAHGIEVDAQDNVWITDTNANTVHKISPTGQLLATYGTYHKRGDWIEDKGQRLLWQPVSVAFGPDGSTYIGMGHANEGPNDFEGPDPENQIGAARILRLDKDGKYLGQWYGDDHGPGKFGETHALTVDPSNGDVWIGDREQYRIQIYSSDGKYIRTIATRNLPCGLEFDAQGNVWMSTGQDGQVVRIDKNDGRVLGALGKGMGIDPGKFIEANYFDFDSKGAIYVGDTSIGRITKYTPPARR